MFTKARLTFVTFDWIYHHAIADDTYEVVIDVRALLRYLEALLNGDIDLF